MRTRLSRANPALESLGAGGVSTSTKGKPVTQTPAEATSSPTGDFESRRPVGSFLSVTREVLLSPARFFSRIRRRGSLKEPVLHTMICAALVVALAGSYDVLLLALRDNLGEFSVLGGVAGFRGAVLAGLLLLVFSPLLALLGLYVGSAISRVLVRIVVGRDNSGYDATPRAVAYVSAVPLLSRLPVVGLPAGLWGTWVHAVGLRELHGTTTARALVVAAIPFAFSAAFLAAQVETSPQ